LRVSAPGLRAFGRRHSLRERRPRESRPEPGYPGAPKISRLILVAACLIGVGQGLRAGEPAPALRVLFIGNSLTYVNDLPSLVAALAEAAGETPPEFGAVVACGFSLEDHWRQGEARKAIERGKWDFVVLQQGPSASAEGRALLVRYARRFAPEIRRAGAKPALYMVWPSAGRRQDFGGVCDSYRLAAEDIRGMLLPAGEAWRRVEKRAPKLALYSSDGLHPTVAGSYVAGAVIYAQLYGRSPIGLPARLILRSGNTVEVPAGDARLLQEAAAQAIEKSQASGAR
jgi:hypothetical protein